MISKLRHLARTVGRILPLLALAVTARATVYDYTLPNAGNRSLRLNIPDSVPEVRGILIWGNGANSDLRGMATDPEFVALAESMGFAALGTSMWSWFDPSYNPSELSGFESSLQQLATQSRHPELVRAPWLPVGQSNGGSISWSLNAQRPEKVIAVVINKAGAAIPLPSAAALRTPTILISGEHDLARRRNDVRALFQNNRPRGLLGAWAEEEASNHTYGDAFELILPFAAEMYQLRYPAGGSPINAPVTLQPVSESNGWLTRSQSGASGFAEIASYADYTGDRSTAGWLPNRRLAYIYRSFASFGMGRFEATLSSGTGPIEWGTHVTYAMGAPIVQWRAIEFYEGDILLKRMTPADREPLEVSTHVSRAGYNVFHAVLELPDGTYRTTMLRRVFVRAPAIGAVAGATSVSPGDRTMLTAASPAGSTGFNWQIDQGAGWETLVDGAIPGVGVARCSGATSASLTLYDVPLALNNARFRCVSSVNSTSQQSSSVTLAVAMPPALTIASGAPSAAVPAGTPVPLAVTSAGPSDLVYRWFRDGVAVPWLTGSSVSLISGTANVGTYWVTATNPQGLSARTELGTLSVTTDSRLMNLSTRAHVGSGDDVLIAGVVTTGSPGSTNKQLLVRGIGPELSRTFQLAGALPAAQLRLFDASDTSFASATGWEAALGTEFARLGAFPLTAGSRDTALLRPVLTGRFSAHLAGADNVRGIGMLEIYDADAEDTRVRLVNISARARIGTGDNILIGGFVLSGNTSTTVLVRAVGPGIRHVVATAIPKTTLTVFDSGGTVIATNTGWKQPITRGPSPVTAGVEPAGAAVMAQVGATLLPAPHHTGYDSSWDSAMLLTLPAGTYTAHMSAAEQASGVGLMEVYEVR